MKPLAWSYSGLSQFVNCPRQFEAVRVSKTVKDSQGDAQVWGEWVHKQFEDRQRDGTPLPAELAMHEGYMQQLQALPGVHLCEQKVALNMQMQPCDFFAKNVWNRGVIDFVAIHNHVAVIVDFKTGKVKPDLKQLALFALFMFHTYPQVTFCRTRYYWTQTQKETEEEFLRGRIPEIWKKFIPDLKQYNEAFKTGVWQPRQSGLCKAHCPVEECEFNGRGRWR
jgi:hypothetical protein